MASNSETGHAMNIANAFLLNQKLDGFEASYAPSNALIALAALTAKQAAAETKQTAVNTQRGFFEPIQNARVEEYRTLNPLVRRRVRSAAKTCGAGAGFIMDVNKWVNKILGVRVSKAKPTEADPAGTRASQQSFDMKLDHLEAMTGVLAGEPMCNPSAADLKVAALQTKYTALKTANDAVKAAAVPLNNAVIARDKELYMEKTGLVIVEQLAKDEVRGTFGF